MAHRKFINGNLAVANAVKLIRPEVIAAYPITPQSSIVEKLAESVANGELEAEFIKVESEHSALAACFGAACSGCRVFTATSSQGLAYMCEMLPYVSGNRLPVVMAVVNRGMAAPWTIWGDHQDTVSQRDQGWIQLYAENAQEALDICLQAYRLAEDPRVLTPVMVCLDGFVLSHTDELVEIPTLAQVEEFLPAYKPQAAIDISKPHTFCIGTPPDSHAEFKYKQQVAMEEALRLIPEVSGDFEQIFGRNYGGLVQDYLCEDAELILLTMGSVTGTAKLVVDKLRGEGSRVGLLKVRSFRPFPESQIARCIGRAKAVGVLDRNVSFGNQGALGGEVKGALYGKPGAPILINFVAGLGGRDITRTDLENMFNDLAEAAGSADYQAVKFIGLRC